MATITNSNLYPPVVDTYMPAFLIDGNNDLKKVCRVYFSISSYNDLADINHAQVVISNQDTNTSVLNEDKYPCSIKLTPILEDIAKQSQDRFYIEIFPSDLKPEYFNSETQQYESRFEINQYYKVQIRFTSKNAESISLATPQAIDSWLAKNLNSFSEWSSVCLVRGISTPILSLENLDAAAILSVWSSSNVDLVGHLSFVNAEETETMKSYRVKLYDNNKKLIIDSKDLYSNNYIDVNEINYTFKYLFQDGENYSIEVSYITKNLYTDTITYNITIVESSLDKLEAELSAIQDPEEGRIGIRIKGTTDDIFVGNITIRRTSSESNFTIWEDIFTTSIESATLDFTWYDYTVKSGVWYKYCAQKRNGIGSRGIVVKLAEPQMIVFEDIFLNADGQQLKIKFDPTINSFKHTIAETKTDTIGARYPFVKRNGHMNYKEFTLSGLITCFMNATNSFEICNDSLKNSQGISHIYNSNSFVTKEELYQDSLELYKEYNNKNLITDYNDENYERDFREKVLEFLYKNNVKLYRSSTEGNILVKLMNISLTPNKTLGRRVYSFSCTAYEIADFNLENCDLYNVSPLGLYSNTLGLKTNLVGQLNQTIPANTDVLQLLNEKYANYASGNYKTEVQYLSFLRIEISSDPYIIEENDAIMTIADEEQEVVYIGHLAYINDKPIIINKDGIYELKGDNVKITSLSFLKDTEAVIDYNAVINQTEDSESLIKTANYHKKVGQIIGSFDPYISVYQKIWNKYFNKQISFITYLSSLNAIKIEAEPGTIVYVKEMGEEFYDRHVIGETSLLEIYNEDVMIEDFYFTGIHFEKATYEDAERQVLPYNKYVEDEKIYKNLESVYYPELNHIYTLENGDKYIYYAMTWYKISDTYDIECSIQAMIDYYYEIVKGMYV